MSQSPSFRRPILRALVAGAALSALSFPALSLAAKKAAKSPKRRVAVHEEEIDPDRYRNNPQTQAFIGMLVAQYNFDRTSLDTLFAGTAYSATVARLILPPATPSRRSWTAYRGRFIEPIRIGAGVRFWQQYGDTLRRAENEFGVPADVIVGILGVETIYGRDMGNFRVMDALSTLAFDYPDTPNREDRSTMFRNQLKDFLLWCRDTGADAFSVLGSYAGAVGIPQFMPTSIREYAIDYDRDGHIDLRNSAVDAIGSVARFLQMHGWEPNRPVMWNIARDADSQGIAAAAADGQPYPGMTLSKLTRAGLALAPGVDVAREQETEVLMIDLPTPGQPTEYRVGLRNFYVLTRYNRSFFYAAAVYELGQAVRQAMQG